MTSGIDDILDNCYDYVVDGEYASCFSSMLSDAEYYYEVGVPSDAYTYDEETGEIHYYHVLTLGEILFAVVLAAAVFAAVFFWNYRKIPSEIWRWIPV